MTFEAQYSPHDVLYKTSAALSMMDEARKRKIEVPVGVLSDYVNSRPREKGASTFEFDDAVFTYRLENGAINVTEVIYNAR